MKSKSTYFIIVYCSLSVFSWLIVTNAHPIETDEDLDPLSNSFGFSSNELLQDESKTNEKDSLVRNKRTIGFLRQLFPGLSQIIDRKIQQITRVLFRVVGRLILRGGNAGGGGGGGGTGGDSSANGDGKGGRRISITLPTYPPFEDEDEDETETPTSEKEENAVPNVSEEPDLRINLLNSSTVASNNVTNSSATVTEIAQSTEPQDSNTIKRVNRDVSEVMAETTLSLEDEISSISTTKRTGLLSRLREMRNKRSGLFGSSSGGGSGNFLFDIIRLVAGSGVSPEKDEELNAPRDERNENSVEDNDVNGSSHHTDDNYTAGIPGPLTRLFILANRGFSSLIQDLILLCPDSDTKCEHAVFKNVTESIRNEIR